MHNNRNNRETVIIPQTIIVPTKSIIVASLEENPASGDTTALSHYNNALWTLVIKITP